MYTVYTHILCKHTFILDAINRLTELTYIYIYLLFIFSFYYLKRSTSKDMHNFSEFFYDNDNFK